MRRCRIESLGTSPPRRGFRRWSALRHATVAGERCLAASRYRKEDVRVLVNAGVHRDGHVCEPAIAAYLQHALGINVEFHGRRTLSFDLLNGGVGMLNAAHVVASLLLAGEVHAGMVVASEVNADRRPDPSYPYAPSGAALLLDLSPSAERGFGPFVFETREDHAGLCASAVDLTVQHGLLRVTRGEGLEEAFLQALAAAGPRALERDGLRREEVDLVVPPQVSPSFLSRLPSALGVPKEKVLDLTSELPDTLTTSTVLAFERARASGRVGPGSKVLFLAVGSGVTAGAVTYRL